MNSKKYHTQYVLIILVIIIGLFSRFILLDNHFTHIDDICSAIQLLILNRENGTPNKPYDIGYCNPISTKEFLELHSVDTSSISFKEPTEEYSESHFTCASPAPLFRLGWSPANNSRISS